MWERWREILVCPACRGSLAWGDSGATCAGCGAAYAMEGGCPTLVPPGRRAAREAALSPSARPHGSARRNRFLRSLIPPDPGYDPTQKSRYREFLEAAGPAGKIVNLGSKSSLIAERVLNLDLVPVQGVDIVADALALPFADGSLDGAMATSLLEHVPDPDGILREMARALRPGGALYIDVPFLFGYHPDPEDYRRYTRAGLAHAVSTIGFEVVKGGSISGPASVLCAVLPEFAAVLFDNYYAYNAVKFAGAWLATPVKYLDFLLSRGSHAEKMCAGVYVLARKPQR